MFTELMNKYKQAGWFEKYPASHIIYPALEGESAQIEETDSEFIENIKSLL